MSLLPNRPTFSVIIPALNEEGNIGTLVAEIFTATADTDYPATFVDVVVVDNGSNDRTAEFAIAAGAVVVAEPKPGYGRACFAGALSASNADILVFMDGDRSEVPAEMAGLLVPLIGGTADFVIGSRVRGYVEPGALSRPQRAGNRVASITLRLLYGLDVTDLGPFRAIRRVDLLSLGMTEMTYGWPTEMLARSAQAGLRVHEIPVSCRRRVTGVSKVSGNPKAVVKTGWRISQTIWRVRRSDVPRLREIPA